MLVVNVDPLVSPVAALLTSLVISPYHHKIFQPKFVNAVRPTLVYTFLSSCATQLYLCKNHDGDDNARTCRVRNTSNEDYLRETQPIHIPLNSGK